MARTDGRRRGGVQTRRDGPRGRAGGRPLAYRSDLERMVARLPDRCPPNPHPAPHADNAFTDTKPARRRALGERRCCPTCGHGTEDAGE